MKSLSENSTRNIVVNWHLLEPCQFKCKYCYAEWAKAVLPEVYKDQLSSEALIGHLAELRGRFDSVRLSFAGGEPLLDKNLPAKIGHAIRHGLDVSIITNGGLLTPMFVRENARKISMLGVSIDSLNIETNLKIGRATRSGKPVNFRNLIGMLELAREINPDIDIKINTVVNRFNFDEDLSALIDRVRPDKWKVLRVLPATERSGAEKISDAQFAAFRKRHVHFSCVQFEDNECMKNSYLMIDPYGRFFFNKKPMGYGYSNPILKVGIWRAFAQIDFDEQKFVNRYVKEPVLTKTAGALRTTAVPVGDGARL